MIITSTEIIYMIITILAVGYIFMDFFKIKSTEIQELSRAGREEFFLSVITISPAIILHELGHKFTALILGFNATFYMNALGLLVGIVLKFMNSPIIFFIPAYVSVGGVGTTFGQKFADVLIPLAGPLMNGLLYLISLIITKYELVKGKWYLSFWASKKINLFLMILNMIPFPGTDGYHFFRALFRLFVM